MRPPITATLVEALSRPTQTTLTTLINEYQWSDRLVLQALGELGEILDAWNLELSPSIGTGGLDDSRIVRAAFSSNLLDLTCAEIARGEGASLEFKESLVLDVKKHVLGKQPIEKCFSADVLQSSLKTVAAYLNSGGGTLLIGVADDGKVVGLNREFLLIPGATKYDFDEWELYLRSMIEKCFQNGRGVSASVQINRIDHEAGVVARIVVGARRELCILRAADGEKLFVRTGNRTLSVNLIDLEQYFNLEKRYL
ncbi:ATP-binding protein [Bradyrhizobium sp. AUGA SZCCT0222]|uniref:AlbA family DNA-binding domain-containing protein n=1 Tax=Bradyrhizobium sp. AUGA SZCCT0222 TaxID=2807668 RepID=UPI001BAE26A3|nr:ATP-binding protein [Bradyrhizobium sp. AUGA SZCCT0222]MBR1272295.1 ATP-binding protein [Bradyrhizobium sp. AUGA SZCCT0222]